MKAVIIKGLHQVKVEDWPIPSIQAPGDVIIKTHVSGLCGRSTYHFRHLSLAPSTDRSTELTLA